MRHPRITNEFSIEALKKTKSHLQQYYVGLSGVSTTNLLPQARSEFGFNVEANFVWKPNSLLAYGSKFVVTLRIEARLSHSKVILCITSVSQELATIEYHQLSCTNNQIDLEFGG